MITSLKEASISGTSWASLDCYNTLLLPLFTYRHSRLQSSRNARQTGHWHHSQLCERTHRGGDTGAGDQWCSQDLQPELLPEPSQSHRSGTLLLNFPSPCLTVAWLLPLPSKPVLTVRNSTLFFLVSATKEEETVLSGIKQAQP